jgi:hypothetical protein
MSVLHITYTQRSEMTRVGQNRIYTPYTTVYRWFPCQQYRILLTHNTQRSEITRCIEANKRAMHLLIHRSEPIPCRVCQSCEYVCEVRAHGCFDKTVLRNNFPYRPLKRPQTRMTRAHGCFDEIVLHDSVFTQAPETTTNQDDKGTWMLWQNGFAW